MSFLFINKTFWLNNLKTRTVLNTKFLCFLFVLKRPYVCYYVICMAVPLTRFFSFFCFILFFKISELCNSEVLFSLHPPPTPCGLSFGSNWVQKTKTSIFEISRMLFSNMNFNFVHFTNFYFPRKLWVNLVKIAKWSISLSNFHFGYLKGARFRYGCMKEVLGKFG